MIVTAPREPRTDRQAAIGLLAQTARAQHDAGFDVSVLHRQVMPPGAAPRAPQHPHLRRVRAGGAPPAIAFPLAPGLRHPPVHEHGEPVTPSEIHAALADDDTLAARHRHALAAAHDAGVKHGQRLARQAVPASVWWNGFAFGALALALGQLAAFAAGLL